MVVDDILEQITFYHHGVKGQKWGIRRYQPYPKGKHGTFLGQDRDEDVRIKKGTEAYRVQRGDKLSGDGQSYVSFSKLDSLNYLSTTAEGVGGLGVSFKDGTGNVLTMKLTRDLIAPSYKKTMDAFIDTVNNVGVKNVSKDMYDSNGNGSKNKERAKRFIKNFKHLNVDECLDNAYEDFVSTFMKDTVAKRMFLEDLKSQGYNALIDENDKKFGKDGFADSPMIVFDKQSSMQTKKVTPLTEKDYLYFLDRYQFGDDEPERLAQLHPEEDKKWKKWTFK